MGRPGVRLTSMNTYDPGRVIGLETERFTAVLSALDPQTPAPSTPGWTAADLLWHLTEVHHFWAAIIGEHATTDDQIERIEQSKPARAQSMAGLAEQCTIATEHLLAALSSRADDEPAWSWFEADQSVGFTRRMQVHEASIHRVDAELTADRPVTPIEPDVARDGIDHVLDVMWAWPPPDKDEAVLGVVRLDELDDQSRPTGRSWPVDIYRWSGVTAWNQQVTDRLGGRRADPAAQTRTSIAGTAHQLDLLVWGRPVTVQRFGDDDLLADFDQLLQTGIV